jgi:hypothetical protein
MWVRSGRGVALAVWLVAGCRELSGCRREEKQLDVRTGEMYAFDSSIKRSYELNGYTCRDAGALYDARGVEFGRHYVCTKC